MPRAKSLQPAYCLDKSSSRAFVTLNRKRKYLGKHNTSESRGAYHRALSEWAAAGYADPVAVDVKVLTVAHVIVHYWRHARVYYRRADRSTAKRHSSIAPLCVPC